MAINMEYLSNFIIAAEYQNFTLAAERLFMSQSTLSRQIKDLEDECGTALFIRNGRTVTLTKAGQALYDAGRPLLAHLEQVTNLVASSGTYNDRRITIYSIPAYFDELTEVYRRMKAQGLHVDFCIHHIQQAHNVMALLETEAIFLITYDTFLQPDDRYVRIPFVREGFSLVCSQTHPLAGREQVSLAECLKENILFGKDFPLLLQRRVMSISAGDMGEGNLRLPLPSYYAPVCLNEGVLILPASAQSQFSPALRYIPISDEDLLHNIVLVYKKDRYLSPMARTFLSELEKVRDSAVFPPAAN